MRTTTAGRIAAEVESSQTMEFVDVEIAEGVAAIQAAAAQVHPQKGEEVEALAEEVALGSAMGRQSPVSTIVQ